MGCTASVPLPPKDEKKKHLRAKKRRQKINPDDLNPNTAGPPPEDPAVTDICAILSEAAAVEEAGDPARAIAVARTAATHFSYLCDNDGGFYAMLTLSHIARCNFSLRKWRLAIADSVRVMHLSGTIAKEKLRGSYLTLHHLTDAVMNCARSHMALADGQKDESPEPTVLDESDDEYMGGSMFPPPPPPPGGPAGGAPPTTHGGAPPPPAASMGLIPPVGPDGEPLDDPALAMFTSLQDSVSLALMQLAPAEHMKEAEVALLRGIGMIEDYHSRRSDLLVQPLGLLAEIYLKRGLPSLSELTIRKQLGVLLILYGPHDAQYLAAQVKLNELVEEREKTARVRAATTIAKTWRMRRAMVTLAKRLGREKTTRHTPSEFTNVAKAKDATETLMHALHVKDRAVTETMRPADAPVEDNRTRLQNMCYETSESLFGVPRPASIGKRRKMAWEPVRAYAANAALGVGPLNESDGGGIAAIFRHSVMASDDFEPFVVGLESEAWPAEPTKVSQLATTKLGIGDNATGPRGAWCIIAKPEELSSPAARM